MATVELFVLPAGAISLAQLIVLPYIIEIIRYSSRPSLQKNVCNATCLENFLRKLVCWACGTQGIPCSRVIHMLYLTD